MVRFQQQTSSNTSYTCNCYANYHCEEAIFHFVYLGNTNLCITGKLFANGHLTSYKVKVKVKKIKRSAIKI